MATRKTYSYRIVFREADGTIKETHTRVWYARLDAQMDVATRRKVIAQCGGTFIGATLFRDVEAA